METYEYYSMEKLKTLRLRVMFHDMYLKVYIT